MKSPKWTKEEEESLTQIFADPDNKMGIQAIADLLGRTHKAIERKKEKMLLGSSRQKNRKPKPHLHYPKKEPDAPTNMHVTQSLPWTETEDTFLQENQGKLPAKEIAKQINRTLGATYARMFVLRKKQSANPEPPQNTTFCWNSKEDNFLIENYGKISTVEIAEELKRSLSSIYTRVKVLKENGENISDARHLQKKRIKIDENTFELLHNYMLECDTLIEVAQKLEFNPTSLAKWLRANGFTPSPKRWRSRFPSAPADRPAKALLQSVVASARMLCEVQDPRSLNELKTLYQQSLRLGKHYPEEIAGTTKRLLNTIKLLQPTYVMDFRTSLTLAEAC